MIDAEFLEAPALLDGGGHRVTVVGIEPQVLTPGQVFPHQLEHAVVLVGVRILTPAAPVHADLERAKAPFPAVPDQAQHFFGLHPPAGPRAPVQGDRLPPGAAHQRVHGQSRILAEQVPERDIDRPDSPAGQLVGAFVAPEGEGLPVPIDRPRVFADQRGLDGALKVSVEHRAVAAGPFRVAFDAGVGLDAQQSLADDQGRMSDVRDFHDRVVGSPSRRGDPPNGVTIPHAGCAVDHWPFRGIQ